MSSSSAAGANAEDVATADPREFEKKTQDELDDILNRCVYNKSSHDGGVYCDLLHKSKSVRGSDVPLWCTSFFFP